MVAARGRARGTYADAGRARPGPRPRMDRQSPLVLFRRRCDNPEGQLVHAASDPRRQALEAAGTPRARRERRATIGDARY